jgi:hypothetical protein
MRYSAAQARSGSEHELFHGAGTSACYCKRIAAKPGPESSPAQAGVRRGGNERGIGVAEPETGVITKLPPHVTT